MSVVITLSSPNPDQDVTRAFEEVRPQLAALERCMQVKVMPRSVVQFQHRGVVMVASSASKLDDVLRRYDSKRTTNNAKDAPHV